MHSIKRIKIQLVKIDDFYNHNFSRYSLSRQFPIQATTDPQYRNKCLVLPHPAIIYIFKREN
jgi:hypothetical protein